MDYISECNKGHKHFEEIEKDVINSVISNLKLLEQGQWKKSDDELFTPFTMYMMNMREIGMSLRPILTLDSLDAQIASTESIIGRTIHKGAYFYNTGLCYFLSFDFTHFLHYLNEAGVEDVKNNGSNKETIFVNHSLSKQVLIEPWQAWFSNIENDLFKTITKNDLTTDIIIKLVKFLANDPNKLESVLLFYKAIYMISASQVGPDNTASSLDRVRALADLVLVYENTLNNLSSLSSIKGQLFAKSEEYLKTVSNALKDKFLHLNNHTYAKNLTSDLNQRLDNILTTETPALKSKTNRDEIISSTFFISYSLRNNLMHILENSVSVYSDKNLCNDVFAVVLGNLYLIVMNENSEVIQ